MIPSFWVGYRVHFRSIFLAHLCVRCQASPSPCKALERRTRRLNFSQIRCPGRFLSEDDDFVKLGWYPVSVFPATSCRHAVSPANMPRVRSEREAVRSSSLWQAWRGADVSIVDDAGCVKLRHERPRELSPMRFLRFCPTSSAFRPRRTN